MGMKICDVDDGKDLSFTLDEEVQVPNFERLLSSSSYISSLYTLCYADIDDEHDENDELSEHRNDREEIRRKLAMGPDNEDYYGGERIGKRPSLQARLQSGMNLQICFMNETAVEQDVGESNVADVPPAKPPRKSPSQDEVKVESPILAAVNNVAAAVKVTVTSSAEEPTDFLSRQAKLQAEARLALAQAKQMARMQIEVEKQRKKKSPIAEMVGIPFPDCRRKLSRHVLTDMNVAQLQVIVNDLHSQIESLNEELVHLLLERDDLHMEQDSMLVDIEDLTRYL